MSVTTLSVHPAQQPLASTSHVGWVAGCSAFALALLSNFPFHALGTLNLAEPLAVVMLPILLGNKVVQRSVWFPHFDSFRLQLLLLAFAASLAGYLLSDFYWGSSLLTSAKGSARLVVLLINGVVLWMLLSEHRWAWVGFLLGVIVGRILLTLFYPPLFNDYWKFGFALPTTYACLLLCAFWGRRHLLATTCLLGTLVAVNLFLGSRSAALLLFAFTLQRPFAFRKRLAYRFVLVGALVGGAAAVATLTSFGVRDSTSRSDIQRRTHIQFCLDGIAKHPWIGNGTWYEASGFVEHYHELLYRNSEFGRHGGFQTGGPLDISLHCQLLNSWAEGGLLGSSFFFLCLFMAGRDLAFRSVHRDSPSDQLRDYFLLQCLFALAFSPFSGISRWPLAFQLWFLLKRPAGSETAPSNVRFSLGAASKTPRASATGPREAQSTPVV